jgi:5-methylcytosine-specific restriction enzyme subunit McrC
MDIPKILVVNEHEEIELPEDLLSDRGYVQAFTEALERDFFTIRLKKGRLVFQAGGYVGIIPVNNLFMLDIRPKVPLANLERVLLLSNSSLLTFNKGRRAYNTSKYSPKAISDFLWTEFISQAELIHELGLQKEYENHTGVLNRPKGKILPYQSKLISSRCGTSQAKCSWQIRTTNTAPNRLIKYLLNALHEQLVNSQDKNLKRRVAYCLSLFDSIPLDREKKFLHENDVINPDCISSTKDHYRGIIKIGCLILNGGGLSFLGGNTIKVDATSLLISMDRIFEDYVRNILQTSNTLSRENVLVLDGNKGGNLGARKQLLEASGHINQLRKKIDATPDILLKKIFDVTDESNIILEVKYKSIKLVADRSDINQVIAYACSYNSKCAVLVFPASNDNYGLVCLGSFGRTMVFQYFIDLTNQDIEEEEEIFSQTMLKLFDD